MNVLETLATSWPFWLTVGGVVVVIVFLVIFRGPLVALIGRIRSIGKHGVDATGTQEQKSQPFADPRKVADELLAQINVNPHMKFVQDSIEKELQAKNLPIDSETARVLLGYTAALGVGYDFQRIYSFIWGSQISILNFLNSAHSATRTVIQPFYDLAAIQYPDTFSSYTFEQYIDFLASQGLIQINNNLFTITFKGRSFLLFIVSQGYTQNKTG